MWITDQTVDWRGSNFTIRTPLLTGGGHDAAWPHSQPTSLQSCGPPMKVPPPSSSAWPARSWVTKVQIRQLGRRRPLWHVTEAHVVMFICAAAKILGWRAETATVWPSRLSHAYQREKMAGDGTHNNAMRLCIYVLPVPPASAPCTRRIAGGLSTRRAINLITGDTFWEPVIGRKPVNRLTGYRFTSLNID